MKTVFFAVILLGPMSYASIEVQSIKGTGQVHFEAVGRPSMLKIKGSSEAPQGHFSVDGKTVKGQVELNLQSLETGIGLRDEHMKNKYLQVDRFPKALLKITNLTLPQAVSSLQNLQVQEQSFEGVLNLHGIDQPVSGRFSMSDAKSVQAHFQVKLSDFKVDIPAYMGIIVADLVQIDVQLPLEAQK